MSRSSKYCTGFVRLPNKTDENSYINKLKKTIKEHSIDVLMPMEDETVELIISNKELFEDTHTLLPDYDTFMIARDKGKTVKKAIKHGLSSPKTYFMENIRDLELSISEIEFPVIIKPRLSSGSRGLAYVENEDQLLSKYRDIHKDHPLPIIQQYVTGNYEKIQVLVIFDTNHELKGVCTYQGIREFPIDGGPVTLWKTVSLPELENKTIKFMKQINWTGFAEVEFIVDHKTGEYFLMEINPRFSANIALAVQLGIEFPIIYTKLALQERVSLKGNDRYERYCQWLIPGDLLNFILNKKRYRQEIGYFFNKPKNLYYAILSKRDFKPVLIHILSIFLNIFGNLKNLKAKLSSSKR